MVQCDGYSKEEIRLLVRDSMAAKTLEFKFDPVTHPFCFKGHKYALDVVSGKIPNCSYIIGACKRYLSDLKDKKWVFDQDKAERFLRLAQKFDHVKGEWKTPNVEFEPWQCWIFMNIFGFINPVTGYRRFRTAHIEVPRGHGKSLLASIVALYILALDNPKGNEISCFATKSDQARIVLDSSRVMAKENAGFLRNTGTRVLAHQIKHEKSNSIMKARSSKSGSLDGLNDILSIIDELHAVSRELFDVIISGLKKRADSLLLCITTAGFNTDSVGHDQSQYARQVSTGKTQDDTFFGVVYTIDEGDDIYSVETWKKANPNWGVSVDPVNFEAYANKTKVTPADLPNFKVKHLNMWLSEAKAYYDLSKWDACADESLRIEDFYGQPCNVGIDLASKIDLTALVYVFRDDKGVYTIFDRCYVPKQTVDESGSTLYLDSISKGHLIATPGEAIHYPDIYKDLLDIANNVRIQDALYDPWNATEFAQKLTADRINAVEFKMNTANFSEPTKALDALMRQGKIRHNGSKLLRWCIGNVVCKEDAAGNVYPRKSHEKLKIDPAIALIMALASWIQKEQEESIYETRGIIII